MKRKRVLAIVMSGIMAASLAACGSSGGGSGSSGSSSTDSASASGTESAADLYANEGTGAKTDVDASAAREEANAKVSEDAAVEGMVLLDNSEGILPISQKKGTKIALYGLGSYNTVKGGTGSGEVYLKDGAAVTVEQGFKDAGYTVVNEDFLADRLKEDEDGKNNFQAADMWDSYKHDEPAYDESQIKSAAEQADTAVYVLSRVSGEGIDRTMDKGDYYLSDNEYANLKMLAQDFDKVIVVLNVGGVVDTNFYNGLGGYGADDSLNRGKIDGLDALVLMSQAGQRGGPALVRILNGETNPSGKLTDTWAINIEDYPSTAGFANNDGKTLEEYYTDDIYVGYRYFDTFGKDVAYPFGYGGSYTSFDIAVNSVKADAGTVSVDATVKNTGKTDGKEVVEVYFSAPSGDLEQPYQELAAYHKVEVAAGDSKEIQLTFDTTDMASYDEAQEGYVLEPGNYTIRVGNSSRNTIEAATISLDQAVVTEQDKNNLGLTKAEMEDGSYSADDKMVLNGAESEVTGDDGSTSKTITPTYTPIAFDMLDSSSDGYGSGIQPTADGLTADVSQLTLSAADFETSTPTYTYGAITTYVSSDADTDSAKYAASTTSASGETLQTVDKPDSATLIDVVAGNITMDQLVASMSNTELADLVEGGTYTGAAVEGASSAIIGGQADSVRGASGETTSNMYTTRYIPNIVLADGPAGVRITNNYKIYTKVTEDDTYDPKQTYYTVTGQSLSDAVYGEADIKSEDDFKTAVASDAGLYTTDGTTYYQYCTDFPIGTLLAQAWDPSVPEKVGRAIGVEMLEYNVTTLLAPGMNIHRNPLCGRNFEYYSEDPLITGKTAAGETRGVATYKDGSKTGISVTLKHFVLNNQETDRNGTNSVVSERAAREIYLKGFEIGVKEGKPDDIMSSYNMINGTSAFENYGLLTEILRNEWGYDGLVMTDWYAVSTVFGKNADISVQALMARAGNDLEMPGGNEQATLEALNDGTYLRLGYLQNSAKKVLHVISKTPAFRKTLDKIIDNSKDETLVSAAKTAKENLEKELAADGASSN